MRLFLLIPFLTLLACSSHPSDQTEKWKQEVFQAEQDFTQMVADRGINEAFIEFADEQAVIRRSGKLVKGLEEIKAYMATQNNDGVQLEWKPDFIEVSASGDLAYTYGKYLYTWSDSLGNEKTSDGYFHTVWKRQADGSWKYVWD